MRKFNRSPLLLILMICHTSCVQKTHTKKITFQVNMSGVDNRGEVGIRGDTEPLSWDKTIYLNDSDSDYIFETTLEFDIAQNTIHFKFTHANDTFELEGTNNRIINLEYKPESIVYSGTFNRPDGHQINKD